MSSCEQYQELISRMVDGELSAGEEADLARHIQSCPSCAALFSAFSALSRQIGEDLEEAPLDLKENVMAEIRREEIRRRNRIPTIMRGILSAAACMAVIVGVYYGVSLTRGGSLTAAVYSAEPAAAKGAEDAALQDAGAEEYAVMETAEAEEAAPAEQPAPGQQSLSRADANRSFAAAGQAPAPEPAALPDAAPAEAAEEKAPPREWILSSWDISLLRELLGGEKTDLRPGELEDDFFGLVQVLTGEGSCQVRLYEREEGLYYYDPVQDAVWRSDLNREALEAALG